MSTQQKEDLLEKRGQDLFDRDGDKLGAIEEQPVAEKQAVPKERVRLDKDTHVEEEQVSDTVRKEQIDIDDQGRTGA